jgi:hypothetical protein
VQRIARLAAGTALALSVPLIAMQFTDAVAWSLSDFLVAGALLFGAGLVYVLATRTADGVRRILVGIDVVAVSFLVWAELAVGILGTSIAGL